MKTLSLKSIVLSADFSPVQMGFSEAEVINTLGTPDFKHDCGGGSMIFTYGCYEFYFFDSILHYFQNDHLKADCGNHEEMFTFSNEIFKVDSWLLTPQKDISLKEFAAILQSENVSFNIQDQLSASGQVLNEGESKLIKLDNGVTIDFEHNTHVFQYDDQGEIIDYEEVTFQEEDDFVLNGIRYEDWDKH